MNVSRWQIAIVFIVICFLSIGSCVAQYGRIIGARAFQIDDGSGKILTWDVSSPLNTSYKLHFPNVAPPNAVNYLVTDFNGNMTWSNNPLPSLAPGNIWYGNISSVATPLAPTVSGAILSLDNSLLPKWTTILPLATTVSASQITSGTLLPGTTINAGPGSTIQPTGGTINANLLSGSGPGKYSGKLLIPAGANHIDIVYAQISALSSVTVSVFDPQAMTFGFVEAQVSQITSGTGFRVIFSADYPNSGTGELHYTVINP